MGILCAATVVGCVGHRKVPRVDGAGADPGSAEPVGGFPGEKAPNIIFQESDGGNEPLSSFLGKFVLMNFWATWCAPCVVEMPSLQALHEKLSKEGLVVLAVNVDDAPAVALEFLKKNHLTLPVTFDPEKMGAVALEVRQIPMTFLIDDMGVVRSRYRGARDWDSREVMDEIRSAMEGKNEN